MSVLEQQFRQAQNDVNALSTRPDNDMLLKLYAYYQQATQGDASGDRPGSFHFVKRAKFEAKEAMQKYIDLVASLRN